MRCLEIPAIVVNSSFIQLGVLPILAVLVTAAGSKSAAIHGS
jgi:hypothetical protein